MQTTRNTTSRRVVASLALASVQTLLVPPPSMAARGETLLLSRASGPAGVAGDADSYISRISADGRFVVFESDADNLSPDDDDAVKDIFMRDTETDTTTLISRASGEAGEAADQSSGSPTVSADGRYVVFRSLATNLGPDNDSIQDIFLRDTVAHTTTLVSRETGSSGRAAEGNCYNPVVSADGRYVAFESEAENLNPDVAGGVANVFLRDMLLNTTILVSRATGPAGVGADGNAFASAISADGRFVAFASGADNLSPDDDDAVGTNIFVRDTLLGITTLVSRATGPAGAAANASSGIPSISADGRYVAFDSFGDNLSADGDNPGSDVFVRDLTTATTMLVSRADGPSGEVANADADTPSISADGRFVAFQSRATNLGVATDSVRHIFVRDLVLHTTTLASRADGVEGALADSNSFTYGFALSGDGRYVTFESGAATLSPDAAAFSNVYRRDVRGIAPHCSDVTQTVVREDPSAVALTCTDEEGDPVTRTIVSGPSHGTLGVVDQTAGTVGYTPNAGYVGPDSFTFLASDASYDSPVAVATLKVEGCAAAATFSSVTCRLGELEAATVAGVPAGRLATKLGKLLGRARTGITTAEGLGETRQARKALGKAGKSLAAFGRALSSKAAKKLDAETVASLRAAAEALREDVTLLRG